MRTTMAITVAILSILSRDRQGTRRPNKAFSMYGRAFSHFLPLGLPLPNLGDQMPVVPDFSVNESAPVKTKHQVTFIDGLIFRVNVLKLLSLRYSDLAREPRRLDPAGGPWEQVFQPHLSSIVGVPIVVTAYPSD